MSKGDLVVVGSVAYDDVETAAGRKSDLLGGAATYFSMAASLLAHPRLVGVVGRDFADRDRALLAGRGVDLDGLVTDETGDTFRWGGRYHAGGNHRTTLYTYLNVFQSFRPAVPETYRSAGYVFLANIDPALQGDVLRQIERPRFVGLDTMNFWIEGKRPELLEVLRRVDALVINDEESALLTSRETIITSARALQALGPRTVIIKRGEHGALLVNHDDVFYVPGYPLETVVDPTGAGDTFAGGFMAWLARTDDLSPENLRRAMITGSVLASFCVEGFGTERLQTLTLGEVRERYAAFVSLTSSPGLPL